jgi:hypothetical protein
MKVRGTTKILTPIYPHLSVGLREACNFFTSLHWCGDTLAYPGTPWHLRSRQGKCEKVAYQFRTEIRANQEALPSLTFQIPIA